MDAASLIDYVSIQPRYSGFRRWAEPFAYSVAAMLALAIDVPVAEFPVSSVSSWRIVKRSGMVMV